MEPTTSTAQTTTMPTPSAPKFSFGKYNKTIVAVIAAVLTYFSFHYGANQYVQDAILIASALGVYSVPNKTV